MLIYLIRYHFLPVLFYGLLMVFVSLFYIQSEGGTLSMSVVQLLSSFSPHPSSVLFFITPVVLFFVDLLFLNVLINELT